MPQNRRSIECTYCGAKGDCIFERTLPEEILDELRRRRRSLTLKAGEVLFRAGERPRGIWIVCTGRLKICKQAPDGKQLITRIVAPGEIVGVRSFLAELPYQGYAEAMEESIVAFLDGEYVTNLMAHQGRFVMALLRRLARDLGHAEIFATHLAYRGAKDRLLEALYDLHQTAGSGEDPWRFRIRRQDLAELSGLTLETTVRNLKKLEREGVVRLEGRTIVVADPTVVLKSVDAL